MTITRAEAEALAQDGMAALRSGDAARARDRFRQVVESPAGLAPPWFPLAQACRVLGDDAGERAALTQYLETEPRHLAALTLLADLHRRTGDLRHATTCYRAALAQAAVPGTSIPPALVPLLRAGEAVLADADRAFGTHLDAQLTGSAALRGAGGARLRESLDLLLGRTQLYLQQPSLLYFPGLPQRPFFERDLFDWVPALEAASPAIRAELETVLAEDSGFPPYVEGTDGLPRPNNPLFRDPSWGAFHLWRDGAPVADNAARCPQTMAALRDVPIPVIPGRSPMALFSLLKGGTHIRPHHGLLNTRLICHLPLIVPPDCALRAGAETRPWHPDRLTIFDDSFEHEAWNRSTQTRVVLLFEIWRPELTEQERDGLLELFAAIDGYDGSLFAGE